MARRRNDDDDDDDDRPKRRRARDDDDDDDHVERPKKPSMNNAYTGLLGITFAALAGAAVLFFLDADELVSQPVQAPSVTMSALGTAAAPAAAGGQLPPPGN